MKGSCHCGNIKFEFKTELKVSEFTIRRCDCSYCTKNGSRYISDPNGELDIMIADKEQVVSYQFGTKTAVFSVCGICGSIPVATCEIEGNTYGIVNLNTLDEVDHFGRHASSMSYDEESLEERTSRHKKNWIGKVSFT